jgi:WD40 repeat protein
VRWQLHRPVTLRVLRTEQLAHSGVPWAAFHPTIPLLAVSTHETVVFFDRERGDRLGQLTFAGPRRMRFLEDGTLFLAGTREGCWLLPVTAESPGVIRVGPPRDLEAARGLVEADHENRSTCIFDGSHLRTISRDGQEIARFEASQPAPAHLRLSPDGRYAALGTFGGTFVTVWEMSSGRKVHEVEAWQTHANPTFSPDGRHLVVARRDQHWMFQTGSWQKTAAIPRQRTDALPGWCTFSPDGSLLATPTGRSRLQVLKARSLEPLFELDSQGAGTGAAEFSADASHLAMVSVHREVLLWDLRAARAALRELGLDWSDAPIPEPPPPSPPMRLVIDTRRRGRARGGVLLLNAPGPAGLSSSRP